VYYSGVKLFNILPKQISALKNNKNQFRIALRNYSLGNSFYSIEEFTEHAREQRYKVDNYLVNLYVYDNLFTLLSEYVSHINLVLSIKLK
jgi:hypothetical protein